MTLRARWTEFGDSWRVSYAAQMRNIGHTVQTAWVCIGVTLALSACGGQGLLNQDPMSPNTKDSLVDPEPEIIRTQGADFSKFNAVLVEYPTITADATQGDDVDAAQLDDLRAKLQKDLESAFFKSYARAAAAGPNVLVVQAKIVRAVPNKPLRNIALPSRVMGAGRGYAAVDATISNGADGTLMLRFRDTDATSRAGLEQFSTWGAIEKTFEHWASAIEGATES